MKIFKKVSLLLALSAVVFSACNKLALDPTPNVQATEVSGSTLATLLDDTSYSLLKAAVLRAGLMPKLQATSLRHTIFAPDDNAISASLAPLLPPGVTPAMYIGTLDTVQLKALVSYHIIPQTIAITSIPNGMFANFEYPSIYNPAPNVSPLLRLSIFPSRRDNFVWANNIPIIQPNITATNGIIHKVARVILPPSADLWARIQADADLSFLRAAISRADSGVAAGSRLQDALSIQANPSAIGANLTVFTPTDSAMKTFLVGAIYKALLARSPNQPPSAADSAVAFGTATFAVNTFGSTIISNPMSLPPPYNVQFAAAFSPATVKGLVAYHVLSSQSLPFTPSGIRCFTVNIPTTETAVKTLLNSGGKGLPGYPNDPITKHPGVKIQATFILGFPIVGAATVKGVANAAAANVIIGRTTSDQHCVNGVIHKIDGVLLPQ